ncbi:helix-turn-helix domain-containing protein [Persephonella atlantica]|uniref:Helix-turn-helix domain-containing protein n=1 Tax=Persephonella atlantica TaxID=2699429 RepID=A0ABS1GKD0_9AQUI|nr:helix-turn-helix domain-containing protein [Persephonella atlantica]MBK3333393.1 helix-turn-helix domain-containing protein [Persephonella atlantica]
MKIAQQIKQKAEEEIRNIVIQLYKEGRTQKAIAEEVGISVKKVRKIIKETGLSKNSPSEKQVEYLMGLITKFYEVKDVFQLKSKVFSLSNKQVKGMFLTLKTYKQIKPSLHYYEKLLNIKLKECKDGKEKDY